MIPIHVKQVRDIAVIEGFRPYLNTEVDKLLKTLDNKVSSEIERGELTPEKALSYCMERNSYRKLQQRFDQRVLAGLSMDTSGLNTLETTTK